MQDLADLAEGWIEIPEYEGNPQNNFASWIFLRKLLSGKWPQFPHAGKEL